MNRDEKILKERFGNGNHFTVPEGYFEQFNARLMEHLPEREARIISMQPSRWVRWRPAMLAAACFSGVIFSIGIYRYASSQEQKTELMAQSDSQYYYDIDETADYLMLDNEDIYAMLTN